VANLANAADTGTINQTLVGIGYSGTVIGWYMTCYPSASVTVDVWKKSAGVPALADTMVGTAHPSITTAQFNSSAVLTGWTTAISAGDYLILNIDSNTAASYINLQIIVGT
jgi:hypothetical protein